MKTFCHLQIGFLVCFLFNYFPRSNLDLNLNSKAEDPWVAFFILMLFSSLLFAIVLTRTSLMTCLEYLHHQIYQILILRFHLANLKGFFSQFLIVNILSLVFEYWSLLCCSFNSEVEAIPMHQLYLMLMIWFSCDLFSALKDRHFVNLILNQYFIYLIFFKILILLYFQIFAKFDYFLVLEFDTLTV